MIKRRYLLIAPIAIICFAYAYQLLRYVVVITNPAPVEAYVHTITTRLIAEKTLANTISVTRPVGISYIGCNIFIMESVWRDCGSIRLLSKSKVSPAILDEISAAVGNPCAHLRLLSGDESKSASNYFSCYVSPRISRYRVVLIADTYETRALADGGVQNIFHRYFTKSVRI